MSIGLRILLSLSAVFVCGSCLGHEIRPASLEIRPQGERIEFRWRQPLTGEYTIAIAPELSSGWLQGEPEERFITENSLIKIWRQEASMEALVGQELRISGLDRTITDTLVRIHYGEEQIANHLLKAVDPVLIFPPAFQAGSALGDYLGLGLLHIWSGPDHLLYVLGLILLIHNLPALIATISAFTLAHSITLAGAALGIVQLRPAPVEAVISLSILYLALELVRINQGRPSVAGRWPWLIAFVFGLLHGFGFAGALQEIGLPEQALAWALLLFNLGIEAGQLVFVALVFGLSWIFSPYLADLKLGLRRVAPYGIGSVASFWLLERLVAIF